MLCVNGHTLEPGQQFCAVCGQPAASTAAPAAPAPQGFGPAPQAPPAAAPAAPPGPPGGGFGPPPAAPPAPAAPGIPASAQVEAQAAKWAPVRRQLLALALVLGSALLELSAFFQAMALDHVSWKYRVQQLAAPGGSVGVVGVGLIVAAFLSATTADDSERAADLGAKAGLGVLVIAGIGILTCLLAFLSDLASLGDSFLGGVGLLVAHLGSVLLLLAAAAGAFMTRPAKT